MSTQERVYLPKKLGNILGNSFYPNFIEGHHGWCGRYVVLSYVRTKSGLIEKVCFNNVLLVIQSGKKSLQNVYAIKNERNMLNKKRNA